MSQRRKTSTMVDQEEVRIQKMGLTKLEKDDTFVECNDEWDEKKYIFDKLSGSDLMATKPKGTYFEIAENPGDTQYIPCHLMILVVVLQATIQDNRSVFSIDYNDQDITLEAEYTWAMEEAAEWNKEHMTFDEIKAKDEDGLIVVPLKHASDPQTYPVPSYYEYIPVNVRNAEDKYKKYSSTNM